MPGSVKKYFKKKASSLKNAFTGRKEGERQPEGDSCSLWSNESDLSNRERSYSCDGPDTRIESRLQSTNGAARCHSEELVHSLRKDDFSQKTFHPSLGIENNEETARRCWSQDEINRMPKKKSVLSRLLCTIPEMDHNETKYAYTQSKSIDAADETVPKTLFEGNEHDDDINIAVTANTKDLLQKPNGYIAFAEAGIEANEVNDGTEDVNATSPERFKDPATSSGISSLQFDLPDKNEGPLMKEFIETACKNTVQGQFSSTPHLNHRRNSCPAKERTDTGEFRHAKSMTNIKASGNLQFNFIDGTGRASESPTSHSALFAVNTSQQNEDTDKLQAKSSVQMRTLDGFDAITDRSVFSKALEVLRGDKGIRVVVLLSYSGEGKTVTGIYLTKKTTGIKHRYLVRSTKEWETIFIKEKQSPNTVVFMDNFLGVDKFSMKQYEEWEPFFDEIFSASTNGNVSVVISMNKRVFDYYTKHHRRHALFADEFIMDLSKEYRLTSKETYCLIRNHLKVLKHGVVDVKFCKEKSEDNAKDFNGDGVLNIWTGTIEQIVNLQYPIGLAKAVAEYASSVDNIKEGVDFFLKPKMEDVKSVDEIRRSKDPFYKQIYFAIGTVLKHGGQLPRDEDSLEKILPTINLKGSKARPGNSRKNMSLTEALSKVLPEDTDPYIFLSEGLAEIRGDFIEKDEKTFHFHCTSIHYSVAVSFGKAFPNDLIDLMPFEFIQKHIGPSKMFPDDCGLYIELNPNTYESLAERIIQQIQHRNLKEGMEHMAMGERSFVTAFLKYVEKEAKMGILFQTVDSQNYTVICYGMRKAYSRSSDANNFTEQVLKTGVWVKHMKKRPQLKEAQERECLKIAIANGNLATARMLIERMNSIDDDSFDSIIKSGSTDLLNTVYKYPTYRLDICRALIKTCSYHWKTDQNLSLKIANALLSKEKNLLIKAHFRTALRKAIDTDDANLLHMLQHLGADLNVKHRDMSLLHLACVKGQTACVNVLLESNANTTDTLPNGMTALHSAIEAGHYVIATLLFRKNAELLAVKDKIERTPLHIAAGKADIAPEIIVKMIELGSDTSAKDKERKIPLHIAITAHNLDTVKVLTCHGSPVTWKDADGQSPIVLAYKENLYYEVETIFRENGKIDFYEVDLLFKALEMQEKSMVKCMLQKINVNVKNTKGHTLLDVAIGMDLFSMVQLLLHEDEIDLEIESKGISPIQKAVNYGNLEIVKLLAAKATTSSVDRKTGDNILHMAAKLGLLDIVTYILKEASDLAGARNLKGETPLRIAVEADQEDVVKLLLNNIESKSCDGMRELLTLETLAAKKRNLAKARNDTGAALNFNRIYDIIHNKRRGQ